MFLNPIFFRKIYTSDQITPMLCMLTTFYAGEEIGFEMFL